MIIYCEDGIMKHVNVFGYDIDHADYWIEVSDDIINSIEYVIKYTSEDETDVL